MRIAFYTLGCKLNQCESEALASAAAGRGFSVVPVTEGADLYIINTCTVTSKAEQKARRVIRKILREHPDAQVVAAGCYAQVDREALHALSDRLMVVGQADKDLLLDLVSRTDAVADTPALIEALRQERYGRADPFAYRADSPAYHTRPFLKIQDGCNNRCAYCRVPLARGNSVSLPADEVLHRLRQLDGKGFREVVLTGVNITAWREGEGRFEDLLERVLAETWGFRIRLSSLEPDMVTPRLAGLLADERICPHFHIPIQSGSDAVLKAMGRHYDASGVRRAVDLLIGARPGCFIAADVITGFPGETDADFQDTLRLVSGPALARLHVFPFSIRPGTRACTMAGRVPERTARERSAVLLRLSEDLHDRYLRQQAGSRVTMLLLEPHDTLPGAWWGLSENYLQLPVTGLPQGKAAPGVLCNALVTEAGGKFTAGFTDF